MDVDAARVGAEHVTQVSEAVREEARGRPGLVGPAPAEQPVGHRVERADREVAPQTQPDQPPAQLAGRLAGERDRQDVLLVGLLRGDAMGDAAGHDGGLARAGCGDDRDQRLLGGDRGELVAVQPRQQLVDQHCRDPTPGVQRGYVGDWDKLGCRSDSLVWTDKLGNPPGRYSGVHAVSQEAAQRLRDGRPRSPSPLVVLRRARRRRSSARSCSGSSRKARLEGDPESVLGVVALVLIVGCVLWLVARYVKWVNTNFVITSDRLIFRYGVIGKNGHRDPARTGQQRQLQPVDLRAVRRRRRPGDRIRRGGRGVEVHRHPQARAGQEPHPLPDGGERAAPRWLHTRHPPPSPVWMSRRSSRSSKASCIAARSAGRSSTRRSGSCSATSARSAALARARAPTRPADVTAKLPPPPPPGANR